MSYAADGRLPLVTLFKEAAVGRIVSTFFISLDGVVESPDKWHFPYFDDDMGASVDADNQRTTAYLMGRVLYEEWAGHWPQVNDPDDAYARMINTVPKSVVSTTLTNPTWNNTSVISGDVAAGVRDLKAETDGTIGMFGSATTVRWLLAEGLLDELHLLVHPIAVGSGQRLFDGTPTHPLNLVQHEVLKSGVLDLRYAPGELPTTA